MVRPLLAVVKRWSSDSDAAEELAHAEPLRVPGHSAHPPFICAFPTPGAPALCLRVNDPDGLLTRLRAAGVPVTSARGEVVQFTATTRHIFVTDPNGLNIELYETK
jgi:catechol 2,3-dioxygenase-like lactoylglutathione lyase family enzyme